MVHVAIYFKSCYALTNFVEHDLIITSHGNVLSVSAAPTIRLRKRISRSKRRHIYNTTSAEIRLVYVLCEPPRDSASQTIPPFCVEPTRFDVYTNEITPGLLRRSQLHKRRMSPPAPTARSTPNEMNPSLTASAYLTRSLACSHGPHPATGRRDRLACYDEYGLFNVSVLGPNVKNSCESP